MTPILFIVSNVIALSAVLIGTIIAFSMLIALLLKKRIFEDVQMIVNTNNYFLVFLLGVFEMMHTFEVLRGDLEFSTVSQQETWTCRIRAYIEFSLVFAVYLSCALQAAFRLCRIVYSHHRWLVRPEIYLIFIPILWCLSFISISPLVIWHGHRLIPGEHTCRIRKDDPRSIAYATIVIYGLPFICLSILYLQVHRFLRRQSRLHRRLSRTTVRHQKRDILVFRRILIVITLLGSFGLPNAIMLILFAMTGELVAGFYRILTLSFAACVLTLSITLFYIDPQLQKKLNTPKHHRKMDTTVISRLHHRSNSSCRPMPVSL